MIRKWHAGLFVLGAAVFAYLVARIGLGQLASDAGRTGLMFVPIVLLYALVYACSALSWQLTMATDRSRPSFWRTYAVTIAAGAINFLTPVINAGGEPYRVAAMAPILGRQRAAGSVILHKMLHSFAYVLVWLTAIVLAFALLPRDTSTAVLLILGAAGVLLLGVVALFMSVHRSGLLERILDGMQRVPVVRRLAALLEPRRTLLIELDLIIGSLGYHITYLRAFAIGGLEALAGNVLFFVPFELGAREGAFYVLFGLFGLDPQLGLYASIVSRVRDIVWIGAGLLLIWPAAVRERTA